MSRNRGSRFGGRETTTRVRTARRRSASSTRWLQRQLNDPYVQEAKRRGYPSRAAFKLLELDDKVGFLSGARRIVDLGAAPGGWSAVSLERATKGAVVVGVDIAAWTPPDGSIALELDVYAEEAGEQIRAELGGLADVVLSDMAPRTVGHTRTDQLRILALAEAAYDLASELLAPDGVFVVKLFQGGLHKDLLDLLKRDFEVVRHVKPPASRKESSELYIVARGYRAPSATTDPQDTEGA